MDYRDDILNSQQQSNGECVSNWPQLPAQKERKAREFYAIDVDGVTVATAKAAKTARPEDIAEAASLAEEIAKAYGGVVRFVRITEETLVQEAEYRRGEKAFGNFISEH